MARKDLNTALLGAGSTWILVSPEGLIAKEVFCDPNGGQRFQKVVEKWCKIPA